MRKGNIEIRIFQKPIIILHNLAPILADKCNIYASVFIPTKYKEEVII